MKNIEELADELIIETNAAGLQVNEDKTKMKISRKPYNEPYLSPKPRIFKYKNSIMVFQ